ncbi:N-acetylmuramoyl-L-alanine amidase [Flagellimonas sp. S3867]|uniref:N-acetylmuramoyl-L-alanine amidase n=1 Tax=Flagellimonas sp. S3867 TaxID=2768063 RepID=UPI001689FD41|nr:N-acetylmuramoyl-L-alanine amidase [Flagellimonas sp. S3867]
MKLLPALLLWAGMSLTLVGQTDYYDVVAEPGDGIYSILRKQGLDPVTYYETFLNANLENIKNGSQLHEGRTYKIPVVDDSFKKTGVKVQLIDKKETPIFDDELANMSLKSRTLGNAIYYLILESPASKNKFIADIANNLAASLMVHGAKVYVFGSGEENLSQSNPETAAKEKMGQYIEAINKRYLQNSGKYQRLLVIRANGLIENGKMDVAVYHHQKSENSQRFAENIQKVFKDNSVSNRSYKDVERIFEDRNSLYLATNTLPAVSLLTIDGNSKTNSPNGIPVRSDKNNFTSLITSGILKDYADLEIED